MFILLQHVGGCAHDGGSEQDRLQFKPGVRDMFGGDLADDGVAGTDDDCQQDQPHHRLANTFVHAVKAVGQAKHCLHSHSP